MPTNTVFAVVGAKGGVGKTTTSLNLAAALAGDGMSVVAVEMDFHMPNFADFLDLNYDPESDTTLCEVLTDTAPIEDAIYETTDEFSVMPSRSTLDADDDLSLEKFSDIIDTLRWQFDIILLDTPAGLSDKTIESMTVADETLVLSTPRKAALQNADNTITLATQHDATIRGFILNKSGTDASPGVDRIADSLTIPFLGHVPEDEAVPHAQDQGYPVVTQSPKSGAALAYQRLARELIDSDSQAQEIDHSDILSSGDQTEASFEQNPPSHSAGESPSTTASASDSGSDHGQIPTATASSSADETTGAEATGAEPEQETTDVSVFDKILSLVGR